MSSNSPNLKPEITPANFPALRSFLRGYFHEDVADEYGTPVDAADQFCEDAESDERNAVAGEWTLLMNVLHGRPLPEINQALTGKLGGAVRLTEEEIEQVRHKQQCLGQVEQGRAIALEC